MSEALVPVNEIELESRTLGRLRECRELKITDQDTYNYAVNLRQDTKEFHDYVKNHYDELREPVYRAYQNILAKQNAVVPKIKESLNILDQEIVGFQTRMRAEQQRREREAAVEAERQAEEQKLQAAAAAESAGYDESSVQAILDAPAEPVTPAPVERVFTPATAINTRDNWSGELTDLWALIKYVSKNKGHIGLLSANQPAINNHIRALVKAGEPNGLPGVRAVNNPVVASSRRGR